MSARQCIEYMHELKFTCTDPMANQRAVLAKHWPLAVFPLGGGKRVQLPLMNGSRGGEKRRENHDREKGKEKVGERGREKESQRATKT